MNALAEMLGFKYEPTINNLNIEQWLKLGTISMNGDKLKIDYTCDKIDRKNPRGRLYILVIKNIVKKIGGSQDKGGIENTISAYFRGDVGKSESLRNYAICKYMKQECKKGNNIDVYFLPLPVVEVEIPTFSGKMYKKEMPVDYHSVEKEFVDEFYKQNGEYPYLNIQESNRTWKELGLSEGYVYKND